MANLIPKSVAYCPNCETVGPVALKSTEQTYQVGGRSVTVPVTADHCLVCGEEVGSDESDQAILDAVREELRLQENRHGIIHEPKGGK